MTEIIRMLIAHAPKAQLPSIFWEMVGNGKLDTISAAQMMRKMETVDFVRVGRELLQNNQERRYMPFQSLVSKIALDRLSR